VEMISALGVQEHELTGSYWANHALHGAQLLILLGAKYAMPHFGLLDGDLSVEYARNCYDSDQRPLRQILAKYRGPMLILHGEYDFNVPPAAAKEHHRLVPRSQLVVLNSNHFMIFQQPEILAGPLKEFLRRLKIHAGAKERTEEGKLPTVHDKHRRRANEHHHRQREEFAAIVDSRVK